MSDSYTRGMVAAYCTSLSDGNSVHSYRESDGGIVRLAILLGQGGEVSSRRTARWVPTSSPFCAQDEHEAIVGQYPPGSFDRFGGES